MDQTAASSDEINNDHFGVNATFDYQPLDSFANAAAALNLTTTRCPDRSESEDIFDFMNPHATSTPAPTTSYPTATRALIPMDAFLAECGAQGIRPAIVVRSRR